MFADQDVCCLTGQALAAEGFNGKSLPGLLRALVEVGFVSRRPGTVADARYLQASGAGDR
jgi:hypothetical protein